MNKILNAIETNEIEMASYSRVFTNLNKTLAGKTILTDIRDRGENSYPAMTMFPRGSGDVTVALNSGYSKFKETAPRSQERYLYLCGVNYHELGHVLFAPNSHNLLTQAQMRWGNTWNVLEDARIEMLMIAKFPATTHYLVNTSMTVLASDPQNITDSSRALLAARLYFPVEFRRKMITGMSKPFGPRFEQIIREYIPLDWGKWSDAVKAYDLVQEMENLLIAHLQVLPSKFDSHLGKNVKGSRPSQKVLRRALDAPEVDGLSEPEPEPLPEPEPEEEEEFDETVTEDGADEADEADGADESNGATEDGDSTETEPVESDSQDSDEHGTTQDTRDETGEADEEDATDDFDGTSTGGKGDEDESEETPDPAPSTDVEDVDDDEPDKDLSENAGHALSAGRGGSDDDEDDDEDADDFDDDDFDEDDFDEDGIEFDLDADKSEEEMLEDLKRMVDNQTFDDYNSANAAIWKDATTLLEPATMAHQYGIKNSELKNDLLVRNFNRAMSRIVDEVEPGWESGLASGNRLNMSAVLADRPRDEIWRRWDDGREEDVGCEIVVLVDVSGSMRHAQMDLTVAINSMIESFRRYDGISLTVMTYNEDAKLLYASKNGQGWKPGLIGINGGTNPRDAFLTAGAIFQQTTKKHSLLCVMTDGEWSYGGDTSAWDLASRVTGSGVQSLFYYFRPDRGDVWQAQNAQNTMDRARSSFSETHIVSDLMRMTEAVTKIVRNFG